MATSFTNPQQRAPQSMARPGFTNATQRQMPVQAGGMQAAGGSGAAQPTPQSATNAPAPSSYVNPASTATNIAPSAPPPASSGPVGANPGSGTPTANGINFSNANDSSVHSTFYNAANQWANQGNAINSEANANAGYYGGLEGANQAAGAAYAPNLITPTQSFNNLYLNPQQQAAIAGNPYQPVQTAQSGTNSTGQELNAYQANLGTQAGAYQANLGAQVGQGQGWEGGALNGMGSDLAGATGELGQGINGAIGTEGSSIKSAITPWAGSALTPAEVQAMATEGGATAGNLYQSQMDQVKRQAAASGNTSPLALAAAQNRLTNEQAGAVSGAVTNAELQAQQAQFGQAGQVSQAQTNAAETLGQQKLAGAENLAQQKIGATENQYGQAENAAQSMAGLGLAGAQLGGQAGLSAAEAAGQAGLQEQENATNVLTGATANAEQQAASRAAGLAQNQQQVGQSIIGQQNQEAGQYLGYLTGQQQLGEAGQLGSTQQQIQNLGAESGAVNQDVTGRANYANQNPGLGQIFGNAAMGSLGGNLGSFVGFAQGTPGLGEPTTAVVGEAGPEMIVKKPSLAGAEGLSSSEPSSPPLAGMSGGINAMSKESVMPKAPHAIHAGGGRGRYRSGMHAPKSLTRPQLGLLHSKVA